MVGGFSSADPKLARGPQISAGEATRRRRSGSGSKRSRPAPASIVKINGNTVTINGQGFSVSPSLQSEFIRKRTGGSGGSAQRAISQAELNEKLRQAKERAQKVAVERVRADLIVRQAYLRNKGAIITRKNSIDFKTKQRLLITETKLGSEKIREIRNLDTGDVTINRYGLRDRAGGTPGFRSGVTISRSTKTTKVKTASEIANTYQLIPTNSGNFVFVRMPDGSHVRIGTKGKGVIGKELAGHKLLFEDGKIISVDGKSTGVRDEYVRNQPEVQLAPPKLFKRITGAFNVKKFRAYREKQRQDYYDLYGLTGKDRNFGSLANAVQTKNLTTTQKNKFTGLIIKDLKEDLLNPDTATRAEVSLIIAAVAGGTLLGGAVGAAYKTPITLAKDLGIEESIKDISWNDVAKKGGIEFGKNALQSYFMMKLFGLGTRAASRVPVFIGSRLSASGLKGAGIFTNKVLSLALRRGLNVVGAQYLASIGVDIAQLGRKVKAKKYKAATVQASGLLGTIVGFYGEKAVRRVLRKVMLAEDPRLILTKSFAKENRHITVARLNRAQKILKKGKRLKVDFQKASPVREPRKSKIVTGEKRRVREGKIVVPTRSAYGTFSIGKKIYLVPNVFLKLRGGKNTPVTYWTSWVKMAYKNGWIKTFKQIGVPRLYRPTIYKGNGEYLPINKGESLKNYYARGQRLSNKRNRVQVLIAPKTVLKMTQKEMEIKTIYPNPTGVKASVTRVKVGKDAFGNTIIIESIAPKTVIQRLKFKSVEKLKFKKEALKYLTNTEAKIAKELTPRIIQNYELIYKSKAKGSAAARNHMLKVEQNFRRILKQYKIKATDAEIKAVSRLHDILKLRGINVKDEPIIRKAILEGYLNKIPLIKKLNARQLKRVADAIGFHQDVNPRTLKALRLNKFTRAFINADRLDITRYGIKVNQSKLFNLKAKRVIPNSVRKEFAKLNRLRVKKNGFTATLRKKYNSLVKKYPGLKGKRFEDKIIAENKARYKKMSTKQKARIRKQEKEYTDYKESSVRYKRMKKGKKVVIPYRTKRYNSYKSPKYKSAYRSGYSAGYNNKYKAPTNYNTKYSRNQKIYAQGYSDGYKGNYKINYKTGSYKYKTTRPPKRPPKKPPIVIPFKPEKKFIKRTISKKVPVFYIKVKKKGRTVNLIQRPLTLRDAKDYLAYKVDNSLVRTAYFEPIGRSKNVVRIPKAIQGYFTKSKRKLRPYKIRVGKRKQLRNGYIEKRKYALDTGRERAQLKKARDNKSKKTKTTKPKIRKKR